MSQESYPSDELSGPMALYHVVMSECQLGVGELSWHHNMNLCLQLSADKVPSNSAAPALPATESTSSAPASTTKTEAEIAKEKRKKEKKEQKEAKYKSKEKKAFPAAKTDKEKKPKKEKVAEVVLVDHTPAGDKKLLDGEFPASYQPAYVESAWQQFWEKEGFYKAQPPQIKEGEEEQDNFVMVIPPPNVTGSLHLGHALTIAIEDTLTRWHRMQGTSCSTAIVILR